MSLFQPNGALLAWTREQRERERKRKKESKDHILEETIFVDRQEAVSQHSAL